jgi:hypothetical protein
MATELIRSRISLRGCAVIACMVGLGTGVLAQDEGKSLENILQAAKVTAPTQAAATQPWRGAGWGPLIFVWDVDHDDTRGVVGGVEFSALARIHDYDPTQPSRWVLIDGSRLWLRSSAGGAQVTALTTRGMQATSQPAGSPGPNIVTSVFDEWELTDYIARAYEASGKDPATRHTPYFTGDGWRRDGQSIYPGALRERAQTYANRMDIALNVTLIKDHPNSNRGRVVSQDERAYIVPTGDTLATALPLLVTPTGEINAGYISSTGPIAASPTTNPPPPACTGPMATARQLYWRMGQFSDGQTREITISNAAIVDVVIAVWEDAGGAYGTYMGCSRGFTAEVVFTAPSGKGYIVIVDGLPSPSVVNPSDTVAFDQGRVAIRAKSEIMITETYLDRVEIGKKR